MSELKTKPTDKNVEEFLNTIENESKRKDCFSLLALMKDFSGEEPELWGDGMIGFGRYTYKYASGRTGEWPPLGFAPRKQNITLYLMCYLEKHADTLKRLGKYKTGKGCLYINHLDDIDQKVLIELMQEASTDLMGKA